MIIKLIKDKNIIFGFLIFLVFCIKFNFFLNIYVVYKNNIHNRLLSNYGFCYPMGYGFIKELKDKYNLNNTSINTYNDKIFPTSNIFSFTFKSKLSDKQFLINYDLNEIKKIDRQFDILEEKDNCFFIKQKND